jgi:hypothetical protein
MQHLSSDTKGYVDKAKCVAADFGSSWMSYAFSLVFSHPADTMRTRQITLGQTPSYTLRVDGVKGLYTGMTTPLVANGALFSLVFTLNETYKRALQPFFPPSEAERGQYDISMKGVYTAGCLAGVTGSLATCPVTVVKLQQQLSGRANAVPMSAWDVVKMSRQSVGVWRGLFRGLQWEATCSGIGRLVYFSTYEGTKRQLDVAFPPSSYRKDSHMPLAKKVGAAAVTAVFGWMCIYPLDVIKCRLQADLTRARYASFAQCAMDTYHAGGVRAFWVGLQLTLARSIFLACLTLPMYDTLNPTLHNVFGSPKATLSSVHAPRSPMPLVTEEICELMEVSS